MAKIQQHSDTIFDATGAEQFYNVANNGIKKMWDFVYKDNPNDKASNKKSKQRSSTKTDIVHRSVVDMIKSCFGTSYASAFDAAFNFNVETNDHSNTTKRVKSSRKDVFGQDFNVDAEIVGISPLSSGSGSTTILVKAPMTSIAKNRFNNASATIGDALRVLTPEYMVSGGDVLFVTFVPNKTYTIDKKTGNISPEKPNHIPLYSNNDGKKTTPTVLDKMALSSDAKARIHEIVISYDFDFSPDLEFKTENDLKKHISAGGNYIKVDERSLRYMQYFIANYVQKNRHLAGFKELAERLDAMPAIAKPISKTI